MKRILVPTDFSAHADYATEVAASIARKTGGRLYLLHVVNMPTYADNYTMRDEYQDVGEGLYVLKMTKMKFQELINKPFLRDVNVVEVLQFNNVYETIATQAKDHDIDIIVMGSHGTSGFNELFIGSNTEKVVRLAECPVLTIKDRHESFQVNDMVFASDFYEEETGVFNKVLEFADLFKSKIHLLKVITPDRFEKTSYTVRLFKDFASDTNLSNYTVNIYNDETVEAGILEFANSINADMIAMTTHGRTGFSHLINGSLTENVVNHAARPVLSIKMQERKEKVPA